MLVGLLQVPKQIVGTVTLRHFPAAPDRQQELKKDTDIIRRRREGSERLDRTVLSL